MSAVHLALDVDGLGLELTRVRGRLALGDWFRFEVDAFVRGAAPDPAALLGAPYVITIVDAFGGRLVARGRVAEVARSLRVEGGGSFALVLAPPTAALDVGATHRVFTDLSADGVARAVLARAGLDRAARFELGAPLPVRPFVAQRGESDRALLDRLFAEEGLATFFDLGEDATTLVVTDDTTSALDLEGGARVPFVDDAALAAARDAVTGLRRTRRLRAEAVTLRDRDPLHPSLSIEGRASRGAGALAIHDAPARTTSPDVAATRARRRLEAIAADVDVLSGEASGVRLVPGRAIVVEGHPLASLCARWLVRSVSIAIDRPRDGGGDEGARVAFDAIPIATPWRPVAPSVVRSPGGPESAAIAGPPGREIHPDDHGRVRAELRWDRDARGDGASSTWMRAAQLPLSGSMALPRVGWDALVAYDADDADAPFVVAQLRDGEHPPPYPLPAHATRTAWGTSTTPGGAAKNELRFEDGTGREELALTASGDHVVAVANALEEKVGADETLAVGGSSKLDVAGPTKLVVAGAGARTVGGSESLSVGAARVVEVAGAETTTIGGGRSELAISSATLDAQGGRSLVVGGSLVEASAMAVARSALGSTSVVVGGSEIVPAASGVSSVTAGAAAHTIGGSLIELAGSSLARSGTGALAITVGAAHVVAAGGNVGESSTATLAITVGGAFVGSAAGVSIEGETEIVVRAGAATLSIRPGSVEVSAPMLGLPSGGIDAGGATVEHD
jgi:type VI secretion system secreted protein VgrG